MSKTQNQDIPLATAVVAPDPSSTAVRPSLLSNDYGRSSRVMLPKQKSKIMDNSQIRALVQNEGFTYGLAEAMTQNNAVFPLRIWIVDNSGSMQLKDGMKMVESANGGFKMVQCTRWNELQETVRCHVRLAGLLQAPTVFRLLNDPGNSHYQQQFSVAEREEFIQQDVENALRCIESFPVGTTPLTEHVLEIRENVLQLKPTLMEKSQKVVVVIATDGIPNGSESEFVEALRSLEGLPVWVVIRLCTDDDRVVGYYNGLDSQLELSLEVLDDFEMEGKEVYEHNKFLNYSLPLHRCREMGFHHRLFDLLDERKLTLGELRDLFALLFGEKELEGVPNPEVDWKGFASAVSKLVEEQAYQWNPITKKVQPWINMKKLNKAYGGGGGIGSFLRLGRS
jgi:Mg-chelatase subunit ChlD